MKKGKFCATVSAEKFMRKRDELSQELALSEPEIVLESPLFEDDDFKNAKKKFKMLDRYVNYR